MFQNYITNPYSFSLLGFLLFSFMAIKKKDFITGVIIAIYAIALFYDLGKYIFEDSLFSRAILSYYTFGILSMAKLFEFLYKKHIK